MAPGECCRPARTAFPFNAAQGMGRRTCCMKYITIFDVYVNVMFVGANDPAR